MPSIAFLFPGQGSQQAGMGRALYEDPELAAMLDAAAERAGVDLRHLLVDAGDDELKLTENAQPALLATSLCLAHLLGRRGIRAAAAAGHSLGEYTALCAAGAVEPAEAVALVRRRGEAMASAAPAGTSGMSAVLGIGPDAVEAALAGVEGAWIANLNTPTQTVIGGTTEGLAAAAEALTAAGARRVLPLQVSAAFHTPLVAAAGEALRGALEAASWRAPETPVVSNLLAEPYSGAESIPASLERQLSSPVRWGDCVRRLVELGCDTFVEVGPRRALTGMMRELAPGATAYTVADPESAATLLVN